MHPVIGVDFDNTLVNYDAVMFEAARAQGLIAAGVPATKRAIRDAVRGEHGGEAAWQRLQAVVYGPRIGDAQLTPGAAAFLRSCRARGAQLYVVSHKTAWSAGLPPVDLRAAAMTWMREQGVFAPEGLGFAEARVFFESSRAEKVARIAQLGCTHFIDDLEETFLEPAFPPSVHRILYAPTGATQTIPGVQVCASWQAIGDHVFHDTR